MLDTYNYFIAGYIVIFGLLALYIGWLVFEYQRLKKASKENS